MIIDGQTLKIVRRALNISQDQLAANLGCTNAYICQIENGWRPMPQHMAQKLREILPASETEISALLAVHERLKEIEKKMQG